MKKQNLNVLKFNKKSISNLSHENANNLKGGTFVTLFCSASAEEHRCDPCN
ncbi:class I lanthipeptide [uncultured Kordia sp.]|uniref:class I lanthipeptide n=1 Tax=uncultured Kordia sp. TaxID=507699 RepID=UPI0026396FFB|nr:class I lanthipeptide [uncultured Kordia sp.]